MSDPPVPADEPPPAGPQFLARFAGSFPSRCALSFLRFQGIDRAMAIAAQAFTALVPLLVLASVVAPLRQGASVAQAMINRFRLTGESAAVVREVFATQGGGSFGAASVVLLLISGVSFTRRVQRMYQAAWEVPPRPGLRGSISAALGLGALLVAVGLISAVVTVVRALPAGTLLTWPVSVGGSLVLWTSIPWLLLDRRIRWRRLLPGGALAAACLAGYGLVSVVYMPRLIESYSRRYGLFGVTLSLIGWLVVTAMIVVAATVVAVEFDRADEPWARRLRGRLVGRAAPERIVRPG